MFELVILRWSRCIGRVAAAFRENFKRRIKWGVHAESVKAAVLCDLERCSLGAEERKEAKKGMEGGVRKGMRGNKGRIKGVKEGSKGGTSGIRK